MNFRIAIELGMSCGYQTFGYSFNTLTVKHSFDLDLQLDCAHFKVFQSFWIKF